MRAHMQKGFTLVEIVIALALVVLITAVLMNGIGPWMKFQQRLDTEQKLRDLTQGVTAVYKANAYNIDDVDPAGAVTPVGPSGALRLSATDSIITECTVGDPADSTAVQAALKPLQPYLSRPLADLASDGFNNKICVQVSPRMHRDVDGARLYYHSIAFISPGDNTIVDVGTTFEDDGTGMVLTLAGDDTGKMVDGFNIALANYRTTMTRLQKMAAAYETYFQIRFLTKADRDISINYFYANNADNNGDPGDPDPLADPGPTAPQTRVSLGGTWEHASFDNVVDIVTDPITGPNKYAAILGMADSEGYDAWGKPLLVDNRSERVKPGVSPLGVKRQPPFSASFGALLPGTSTLCTDSPDTAGSVCLTYISAGAVGKY